MKTPLVLFACFFAALHASGQAQVQFNNTISTRFTTNGSTIGQGTGFIAGTAQWRIGLYLAPDGETNESQFTLTAVATNFAGAGLFTYPNNGILTLSNNAGTTVMVQVRAWTLSSGNSYEEAFLNFNGYIGKSPIGRITPVFPPAQRPVVFGSGAFAGQLTNGVELLPNFAPSVSVLHPNASERLQPGSVLRVRWFALGIPTPDWNVYLRTNNLGLRLLTTIPVNDGFGNWHADVTLPTNLLSGCAFEILVDEDSMNVADISETFCIGLPVLQIRFSQVQLCWNSRSDRVYQPQYRSSATTNIWTSLGSPVPGNGTTNCISDSSLLIEPQRAYRIEELP